MGLTICAARYAKLVHPMDSPDHNDDCSDLYSQLAPDEECKPYLDGLTEGCYHLYLSHGILRFNPGLNTYEEYDIWRDILSRLALGVPAAEVGQSFKGWPFFELINMSDSAGGFGPTTSRKLLVNFEDFASTDVRSGFSALASEDPVLTERGVEFWMDRFVLWRLALTVSSADTGALFFL